MDGWNGWWDLRATHQAHTWCHYPTVELPWHRSCTHPCIPSQGHHRDRSDVKDVKKLQMLNLNQLLFFFSLTTSLSHQHASQAAIPIHLHPFSFWETKRWWDYKICPWPQHGTISYFRVVMIWASSHRAPLEPSMTFLTYPRYLALPLLLFRCLPWRWLQLGMSLSGSWRNWLFWEEVIYQADNLRGMQGDHLQLCSHTLGWYSAQVHPVHSLPWPSSPKQQEFPLCTYMLHLSPLG